MRCSNNKHINEGGHEKWWACAWKLKKTNKGCCILCDCCKKFAVQLSVLSDTESTIVSSSVCTTCKTSKVSLYCKKYKLSMTKKNIILTWESVRVASSINNWYPCFCLPCLPRYRCTSRQWPWPSLSALARPSLWECSTCLRSTWFSSIQSRTYRSASAAWRLWSLQPPCPTSSTRKVAWGPTERPSLNSAKALKPKVGIMPNGAETT